MRLHRPTTLLALFCLCAAGCARDEIAGPPAACQPGATACFDQPELLLECQPDGERWLARRCEAGTLCHQASCQSLVCVPESRTCEGDAVVACSEDGQSRLASEACGEGRTCDHGACVERICEPNAVRCDANRVERCAGNGASWEPPVACAAGLACLEGVCLPTACDEGQVECGPTTLYRCAADGSWSAEACPEAQPCIFGRCVECVGAESCAQGEYCDAGRCRPSAPRVATETLPAGEVNALYGVTLAAQGGRPGYLWNLVEGELPAGISLGTAGELSGVPAAAGEYGFRLQVLDANGLTGERDFTLEVLPAGGPVRILTASLPAAEHGLDYETVLQAAGGMAPYAWQVVSGAMPEGLTLGADGLLSGAPRGHGDFDFSLRVVDALTPPGYDARQFTLRVEIAPLEIVGERSVNLLVTKVVLLPVLVPYVPYGTGLEAEGGVDPYSWSLGAAPGGLGWLIPRWGLPSGLTLGADGRLSGVVTDLADAVRVQLPFLNFELTGYFFVGTVVDSQSPSAKASAIFCMPTVPLSL